MKEKTNASTYGMITVHGVDQYLGQNDIVIGLFMLTITMTNKTV